MELSVESLGRIGGFVCGPVKREVVWFGEGEERRSEVYIRPMSYHTAISDISAISSRSDVAANRISRCVCDKDGAPVFMVSDVTGIDDDGKPIMVKNDKGVMVERGAFSASLSNALLILISEVSGLGKTTPKPSKRQKKNSGTS